MKGLRTSRYGKAFSKNISFITTAVGLAAISRRWSSVAVISSGRSVSYMPPGERKSGMPAPDDIPAPVSNATERQSAEPRNLATPARSREARRGMA